MRVLGEGRSRVDVDAGLDDLTSWNAEIVLLQIGPFGSATIAMARVFFMQISWNGWALSLWRKQLALAISGCYCPRRQCGRDVVSGTVNVTVCLHSAHPANTWC